MKKTELINLDNSSLSILTLNKAELEKSALNLKTKLDPLTEYEALYKFNHLIKYRMECLKDLALETFTKKFEGSQTEKDNGFTITLKQMTDVNYSDKVKDLESEIKCLQEQVKQMKAKEIKFAERTVKGEVLALRMW